MQQCIRIKKYQVFLEHVEAGNGNDMQREKGKLNPKGGGTTIIANTTDLRDSCKLNRKIQTQNIKSENQ